MPDYPFDEGIITFPSKIVNGCHIFATNIPCKFPLEKAYNVDAAGKLSKKYYLRKDDPNMKKTFKVLCTAAILGCLMSSPAFAAETKAEYKEEAAPIRQELKELNDQMKPFREENKKSAARYKAIRLEKKESGSLSVSRDSWKKAKELHKQIISVRKETGETTVKSLKEQAKTAVKEQNFDTALRNLEQAAELKKEKLESLKEINQLWKQIDEVLDQG